MMHVRMTAIRGMVMMPTDNKAISSLDASSVCAEQDISVLLMLTDMPADLRRQWREQGKAMAGARALRREAAFKRQEGFVQRAGKLRELRQGAQQAKYAKQQERLLAQKV